MHTGKFLYLARNDVNACNISWDDALRIAENTIKEHDAGAYQMPSKTAVHPENCQDAFLHAMPGYLPNFEAAGIKWVSGYNHNRQKYGIDALCSVLILNDVETGYPAALMEAGLITAIRTPAVSGVAAKYLARKNCKSVGLIGAGVQGRNHLKMMKHLQPTIETFKIYDMFPAASENLAKELSEELGVNAYAVACAEDAICESDIVITAAPVKGKDPVYKMEWLKPGCLLLPIFSGGWAYETFATAAKFLVDDWAQYKAMMFDHLNAYFAGRDYFKLYGQLGEVVNQKKPGRENDDEIIVCSNLGLALHDISLGRAVFDIAREKQLGVELSLW